MDDVSRINLVRDRIVSGFQPIRVILFGSRATGTHRPDSDVDLLVVMPSPADKRALAVDMRRALSDLPIAKDIVVTTPEEVQHRGDMVGSVIRSALRAGRVIFEHA